MTAVTALCGRTAPSGFVRYALLIALTLHLGAITLVGVRELAWLVANHLTVLPVSWQAPAQKLENLSITALAENLEPENPYYQAIATYINLTGIQGGYGFFAPNVSDSYRLVVEFHYPDGHVERDFPHVSSEESAVRLAGLLDQISRTQIDVLREALMKLLAQETWRYHPDATSLRATLYARHVAPIGQPRVQELDQALFSYELALPQK